MEYIDANFKKTRPDAIIPTYAHGPKEDAGMDLYATEDVTLHLGQQEVVGTGIAVEMPEGVWGEVRSRSGLAAKHGISTLAGTIDPGYRDELKVVLIKIAGATPYEVKKGDRIAQIVFSSYVGVRPQEAKRLSASARGKGGFGSTGA
jgi:dUTP pyrophosphatase